MDNNFFPREKEISLEYTMRNVRNDLRPTYNLSLSDRIKKEVPRMIGTGIIVLALMGGSYLVGLKQGLKYGMIEERNYISGRLDDNVADLRLDVINSATAAEQDSLLNKIYFIEEIREIITSDLPKNK